MAVTTHVRVKICGLTNTSDVHTAVDAGADAIGLVFYKPSPRYVDIEQAQKIAQLAGPFVTVVGLFVNALKKEIDAVLEAVPLQLLQFHGDEPSEFCAQFQRPYVKALRMRPELDIGAEIDSFPSAAGILLDAYRAGVPGGTGETFDWQRVPAAPVCPIILAGGLTPDNVKTAIATTRPYAVDVSGGVESSPGQKDAGKVRAFINNVRQARSEKF